MSLDSWSRWHHIFPQVLGETGPPGSGRGVGLMRSLRHLTVATGGNDRVGVNLGL